MDVNLLDGKTINIDFTFLSSKAFSEENVKDVKIYYLTNGGLAYQPFIIEIVVGSVDLGNYLGVFISVAVVITVICFFICIACFYKCSKDNLEKENQRERERSDRITLMMEIENSELSAQALNERGTLNAIERQQNLIKENKKGLDILLSKIILPKPYSKQFDEYQSDCTICLDSFTSADFILELSCKHIFHSVCLESWLNQNILSPKCPNCNFMVLDELKNIKNYEDQKVVNYWQFNLENGGDGSGGNGDNGGNNGGNHYMFNNLHNVQVIQIMPGGGDVADPNMTGSLQRSDNGNDNSIHSHNHSVLESDNQQNPQNRDQIRPPQRMAMHEHNEN